MGQKCQCLAQTDQKCLFLAKNTYFLGGSKAFGSLIFDPRSSQLAPDSKILTVTDDLWAPARIDGETAIFPKKIAFLGHWNLRQIDPPPPTRPHCGTLSVVNSPCAKTKKRRDCDDMVRMVILRWLRWDSFHYKHRKIIIMCEGKKDRTRIMNSESWKIVATLLVIFWNLFCNRLWTLSW